MIKYHSSSPYAPCILSDSTSVFFLRTSYLGMIKKIFARFRSTGTHVHCLENFPRWFSSALKGKRKTNLEIKHTLVGIFGPNRLTKLHYIIHDLSLSLFSWLQSQVVSQNACWKFWRIKNWISISRLVYIDELTKLSASLQPTNFIQLHQSTHTTKT